MATDRVIVPLDDDARTALETLLDRTGKDQSDLVREALTAYAANFGAATANVSGNLEEYHRVCSNGNTLNGSYNTTRR